MNEMALIDAVKARDYDKTSALIGEGANVNQQNELGWTPLNFAAGKGNLAMVKQSSLWPWQSGRTPRSSASFENH